MRLTRRQLRQIIKEELSRTLLREDRDGLLKRAKQWAQDKRDCASLNTKKGPELVDQMLAAATSISEPGGGWDVDDLEKYKGLWADHPCLNRRDVADMEARMDELIAERS